MKPSSLLFVRIPVWKRMTQDSLQSSTKKKRCPYCGCTHVCACVCVRRLTESCVLTKTKIVKGGVTERCKSPCQEVWGFDLPSLQAPVNQLNDFNAMWNVVPPNGIWVCIYSGINQTAGELLQLYIAMQVWMIWHGSEMVIYIIHGYVVLQNNIINRSYDFHKWISI